MGLDHFTYDGWNIGRVLQYVYAQLHMAGWQIHRHGAGHNLCAQHRFRPPRYTDIKHQRAHGYFMDCLLLESQMAAKCRGKRTAVDCVRVSVQILVFDALQQQEGIWVAQHAAHNACCGFVGFVRI